MWIWGDGFINVADFGIQGWSGWDKSPWRSVDKVPKDIVVCDWQYKKAVETPAYFIRKGFPVVSSPFRMADVALAELDMMRRLRTESDLALGMLQTTWTGFDPFVRAYYGELDPSVSRNRMAVEVANCFKTLFAALRGER
jgi:hypothetical protein